MKITSTKDYKHQGLKSLVYGDSGVGKTVLCSTLPSPIIVSAERGLLSLANHDIPVIEVKSYKDVDEAYQFLTSSKETQKYVSLCVDSITDIAEVLVTKYKKGTKDARQAYGQMNDEVGIIVRYFRDIVGKNVMFTAQLKVEVDESNSLTYYRPSMPGKTIGAQLPYFFDEVYAMRFGKKVEGVHERYLQTVGDLQWLAKNRGGFLDKKEPPNMTHIIEKIVKGVENGKVTESSSK